VTWKLIQTVNTDEHTLPPTYGYHPGDIIECSDCGNHFILDYLYGNYTWRKAIGEDYA
jgi:hypothetical protein